MTNEEAIKWFRESPAYHKDHEPYNMAIKALEQHPCEDATLQEIFCTGCEHKEQQSCPYWDYELKTCRHANIGVLATVTPTPKGDVLEKIRAEITNIHLTDTDGHNNNWYREPQAIINDVLNIIDKYKADTRYAVKVVARGNCINCGKELTEGIFFCKECMKKAECEE